MKTKHYFQLFSKRVAAWSVVLQSPCSDQPSAWNVHPLAAQPLSGLTQTVYRAELLAVVAAVSFAIKASRFCRIWSDCQAVVSGLSKFVVRRCPVNPNHANSDLWRELQVLIWDFGVHKIQLVKVPSHQGSSVELPAFDQWYIAGNSCADRAAKAANQQRGSSVWTLWQKFVDDAASLDALGHTIRKFQVQVAELWRPQSATQEDQQMVRVPVPRPVRTARQFCSQWICPVELPAPQGPFRKLFGQQLFDCVSSWFCSVHAQGGPVHWISFYQLYFHFVQMCDVLILKDKGKWIVDFSPGARLRNHFRLALRVKAFRLMLQQWLKDHRIVFHTATLRPRSHWIVCHRGSLAFPISERVWQDIESFLSSVMSMPANGQGRSLDAIRF